MGLTPAPLLESHTHLNLRPDSIHTIGSGGRGVLHSEVKEEPAQRAGDTNDAEHPAHRFQRQQRRLPPLERLKAPEQTHPLCIILAMLAKLMSYFLLGLIRFLTGAQARWHGCPPKAEQRIYFANHQSHADLVMIWAALPKELRHITRAIAAKDYWTKSPFKQWLTTEVFHVIYVSRDRTSEEDPLEPLIEALANGDSIILFPEGTRGHTGEPQAFKPASTTWPPAFLTWCWCPPGSTMCSTYSQRAKWCRYRCCAL